MAIGTTRREGAQDSLAGRADMQPVTLQGPGVQNARQITPPDTSMQAAIAQQLGKWGSQKLAVAANTRNEKDFLEGQMAYQQGKALDDIDMKGNKWALEGHMFMDAQTLSSSMLAAQQEDIRLNSHTSSPDEFRARYVNRLDQMLEGKDPRTAQIVREQMSKQMPTLVADHTAQHMRYKEGQNYDSLERSIDVISRDPTSTDMLISFAHGGEGSASEGLSPERRQAAVVSGVVRAFENNNPLAFAALTKEGVLGDSLSTQEQGAIRGAKAAFENRMRSEYNETFFNGQQALMTQVENGELSPTQAVEDMSVLMADHGITMNMADAGAIYGSAENGERNERQTRGILLEEAGLRGDIDTQANIIIDSLIGTESSGRANAWRKNDDGREFGGLLQFGQAKLNEYTKATGRGHMTVRQFSQLTAEQQAPANRWQVGNLIKAANATGAIGSTINGVTVTLSGLVAVAHLGGEAGMRKFVSSGGAYNPADQLGTSLTDYLSKHGSGEMNEMFTPQQRRDAAVTQLNETRERMAMDTYERIAPKLADVDNAFTRGEITQDEWRAGRDEQYQAYDVARTAADVNHEIGITTGVENELIKQRDALRKEGDNDDKVLRMEAALGDLMGHRTRYQSVVDDPNSTPDQLNAATQALRQARQDTFDAHDIPISDRGNAAANEEMYKQFNKSMELGKRHAEEQAMIGNAETARTVGTLPADVQANAIAAHSARVAQDLERFASENPEVPASTLGALERGAHIDYLATNGIVDEQLQQTMNLAASGRGWLDKDGKPNPSTVAGLHAFTSVLAKNKGLAFQYVPDPEARGRMMAAAFMVQTEFSGSDVFDDVDLSNRDDPIADAFHVAVEQVGLAIDRPATPEQTEARVNSAIRSLERGNITGTLFGRFAGRNSAQSLIPQSLMRAGLSSKFDAADVNAARGIDNAVVSAAFNNEVVNFLEEVMPYMPATSQQAATTMAMDYVRDRGAVMGNGFVMPAEDQPSIYAQMWPGEQVENTAAPNTAIVQWMQDQATHGSHPVIGSWYEAQGPVDQALRGISPFHSKEPGSRTSPEFTVTYLNGVYRAMIPGHGSVALPMKEIGDLYKATR